MCGFQCFLQSFLWSLQDQPGVLFCSDTFGQARVDSDTQIISKSLGKLHLAERQVRTTTASKRTKTKRNFMTFIMLHPSGASVLTPRPGSKVLRCHVSPAALQEARLPTQLHPPPAISKLRKFRLGSDRSKEVQRAC